MTSKTIKKGKVNISSNSDEAQVNFNEDFVTKPSIKITGNINSNIYLEDVTVSGFKIKKQVEENITVNYIAIEGDEDDLPVNEEIIIVTVQQDINNPGVNRFYFNNTYPFTLDLELSKLYKFDITALDSESEQLQFGFGEGDGMWDIQYMISGSSEVDNTAIGLENSFIDYGIENINYVQLRLESPAEDGVTITRAMTMTEETVNYFHVWNNLNSGYGGDTVLNLP